MSCSVSNMLDLKGRVAIVTGGCNWLGRDMAQALAEYGCNLIITSRDMEKAQSAARDIQSQYGVEALGLALEQAQWSSARSMAQTAFDWKGRIDILVNNAGGGSGSGECDFFKRDPDDIRNMIDINLTGAIYCCKAVAPHMAQALSGCIINIASIAALVGRDRGMYRRNDKMEQPVEYAAAKAGIIGLTQDLSAYMAPYGVRVNCISPGGFDKHDLPKGFTDDYGRATAAGRMGEMGKEIKGAALYLASDAASYVTGHNLVVDGGFHLWK